MCYRQIQPHLVDRYRQRLRLLSPRPHTRTLIHLPRDFLRRLQMQIHVSHRGLNVLVTVWSDPKPNDLTRVRAVYQQRGNDARLAPRRDGVIRERV